MERSDEACPELRRRAIPDFAGRRLPFGYALRPALRPAQGGAQGRLRCARNDGQKLDSFVKDLAYEDV